MDNNTYKVAVTVSADIDVEVFAKSEEEARAKIAQMPFRDLIELYGTDMTIQRDDYEEITAKLTTYGEIEVKLSGIDYEVSSDEAEENVQHQHPGVLTNSDEYYDLVDEERRRIAAELDDPVTVTLKSADADEDHLKDEAIEAAESQTGYFINSVNKIEIIKK